jgi:hypothetical protein
MMMITLGNLQPQQRANITVKLVKTIEKENDYYALRIPTSYFTRFGEENLSSSKHDKL